MVRLVLGNWSSLKKRSLSCWGRVDVNCVSYQIVYGHLQLISCWLRSRDISWSVPRVQGYPVALHVHQDWHQGHFHLGHISGIPSRRSSSSKTLRRRPVISASAQAYGVACSMGTWAMVTCLASRSDELGDRGHLNVQDIQGQVLEAKCLLAQ